MLRVAVVLVYAVAASQLGEGGPAKQLAEARARWAKAAVNRYEMAISVQCFCIGGRSPARFRIVDRKHASPLSGLRRSDEQLFARYDTVDELFSAIERAITGGAGRLNVRYHTEHGYPVSIFIDGSARVADDELRVEVLELVPIGKDDPDEVTPSQAASALIDAPTKRLGETAGQIVSLLRREPEISELTAIGSTQHAIPGAILRLEYPGMIVTLHVDMLRPSSRLFRLDITDMDWLDTLGLKLPKSREEVLKALGTPHLIRPTHLLYQGSGIASGSTLRLTYEGDRLVRAGWAYITD